MPEHKPADRRSGRRSGLSGVLGATFGGLLALQAAGCVESSLRPQPGLLSEQERSVYSDRDWSILLERFVQNGRVDYDALSRQRDLLNRYYALLSVTGPGSTPEQFPNPASITAYWINAYNALMLVAVMHQYPVTTVYDVALPRLEHDFTFQVDRRSMTLAQIEREIMEHSKGDVRALFALHRAALGGPPLPDEPMRGETLERQLAAAAAAALDTPEVIRIDHTRRLVLVAQVVFSRQDDFIAYWERRHRSQTAYVFNVLLDLASPERRRTLQSAVGYTIREMPFDRRLNRLMARSDAARPVAP